MKTKNIFKALAVAMLMPAMMLTTACSNEDDVVNNNENTIKKGYELPVTINVTREGDEGTTRASFNSSTLKLKFSTGDKLFVSGYYSGGGYPRAFAGTLTWTSGGTFSGTIATETEWTGTADALLTAGSAGAILLPNGYGTYGFLSVTNEGTYSASASSNYANAFATSKATGVEQLSYEKATSYSSGFALSPRNAILNFTITDLTASTEVAMAFSYSSTTVSKNVTTDGSGNATFAIGVPSGTKLNNCTLTVGGKTITLVSSSKTLAAGKIYNITRSAKAAANATAEDLGKVIGADGKIYANADAATAAGTTASGIIAYVGSAGSVDESSGASAYKGLAIALTDASNGSTFQWHDYTGGAAYCSSHTTDVGDAINYKNGIANTTKLTNGNSSHTHAAATAAKNYSTARPSGVSAWFLPSMGQWNLIVQGLATKKSGSTVSTNLTTSENSTYTSTNLNSVITDAGGTGLKFGCYWSTTEYNGYYTWTMRFSLGKAEDFEKTKGYFVRPVFAF